VIRKSNVSLLSLDRLSLIIISDMQLALRSTRQSSLCHHQGTKDKNHLHHHQGQLAASPSEDLIGTSFVHSFNHNHHINFHSASQFFKATLNYLGYNAEANFWDLPE